MNNEVHCDSKKIFNGTDTTLLVSIVLNPQTKWFARVKSPNILKKKAYTYASTDKMTKKRLGDESALEIFNNW